MAKVSLYLDERYPRMDGRCTIKLVFRNRGGAAHLSTEFAIPAKCWNGQKVISSRNRAVDALLMPYSPSILNAQLTALLSKVTLYTQEVCGDKTNMSATMIRNKVKALMAGTSETEKGDKTFLQIYEEYLQTLTKHMTKVAMSSPKAYLEKYVRGADKLLPSDIDEEWGKRLVEQMLRGDKNGRALKSNTVKYYLSLLRTVWRFAQRRGYIDKGDNPLSDIHIRYTATKSRALDVETLRWLWNYDIKQTTKRRGERLEEALNFFKLSFILCGLNPIDLYNLREKDIVGGRIMINRTKTGVPINILVPEEGWEIIQQTKADGYIVGKYRHSRQRVLNDTFNKRLGRIMEGLSMYYARHTWMSIGAELDIPDRVLFMGIAHRMGKYSDETYITMKHRKLDLACRKILDYVLQKGEFAPNDNNDNEQ